LTLYGSYVWPTVGAYEATRHLRKLCKVTPVILHGVVSPECKVTPVIVHEVVSPEGTPLDLLHGPGSLERFEPFGAVLRRELGFWVSGFGFGFRVSGFGFRVSGFGFRV